MAKFVVEKNFDAARSVYDEAIAGALDTAASSSSTATTTSGCNETVVRPCLASLYAGRGLLCYLGKDDSGCVRDCDLCIELDPKKLGVYLRKARALYNAQKPDEAIRTLETSRQQNSIGTPLELESRDNMLRELK